MDLGLMGGFDFVVNNLAPEMRRCHPAISGEELGSSWQRNHATFSALPADKGSDGGTASPHQFNLTAAPMAMPHGPSPTFMRRTSRRVAVSTTEISFVVPLAVKSRV
jgi:hypothetical protein